MLALRISPICFDSLRFVKLMAKQRVPAIVMCICPIPGRRFGCVSAASKKLDARAVPFILSSHQSIAQQKLNQQAKNHEVQLHPRVRRLGAGARCLAWRRRLAGPGKTEKAEKRKVVKESRRPRTS